MLYTRFDNITFDAWLEISNKHRITKSSGDPYALPSGSRKELRCGRPHACIAPLLPSNCGSIFPLRWQLVDKQLVYVVQTFAQNG